jgi:hypothetical protein
MLRIKKIHSSRIIYFIVAQKLDKPRINMEMNNWYNLIVTQYATILLHTGNLVVKQTNCHTLVPTHNNVSNSTGIFVDRFLARVFKNIVVSKCTDVHWLASLTKHNNIIIKNICAYYFIILHSKLR